MSADSSPNKKNTDKAHIESVGTNLSVERITFRHLVKQIQSKDIKLEEALFDLAVNGPADVRPGIFHAYGQAKLKEVEPREIAIISNAIRIYRLKYRPNMAQLEDQRDLYLGFQNIENKYFAVNAKRKSSLPIPRSLAQVAEAITAAGHSLPQIVDHILILNSLKNSRPYQSLKNLFPVKKEHESQFRQAVLTLTSRLLTSTEPAIEGMVIESAQFLALLFTQNSQSAPLSKAQNLCAGARHAVLLLEPGLSFVSALRSIKKDAEVVVTSEDRWEALVLGEAASLQCKNNANAYTMSELATYFAGRLKTLSGIFINGDRAFAGKIEIHKFADKVQEGGQIIFDFASYPHNRAAACSQKHVQLYQHLVEQGYTVTLKTGKMAKMDTSDETKPLFFPATNNERDMLSFTKTNLSDQTSELEKLNQCLLLLKTLGSFDNPGTWRMVRNLTLKVEIEFNEEQQGMFSTILHHITFPRIFGSQDNASVLMRKDKFEELAAVLIDENTLGTKNHTLINKPKIKKRPGNK